MGKMKALAIDMMEHEHETITQHEDDYVLLQEEMHYHNTMNAFVELIVVYGYDKVIGDLRTAMGAKEW